MNQIHEPDPHFLEHLEWQLASTRRRRETFGEPTDTLRKRRNIKMIGIVLCSVLTGVMATATTTHLQDVAQGKLYLAQAEIQLQLADSRLELARKNLDFLKERIAVGVIKKEEGDRAEADIVRQEIEKQRLELDFGEVLASHQAARNELSAPLVNGRDFVTERLSLNVKTWQTAAAERRAEVERAQRLYQAGLVPAEELQSAKDAQEHLRLIMNELDEKIALRTAFLRREIPAEKVDLMALVTEAGYKVNRYETLAVRAGEEYTSTEKRHQVGLVTSAELDRARFNLESYEAKLKLALLELEIIQANLNK